MLFFKFYSVKYQILGQATLCKGQHEQLLCHIRVGILQTGLMLVMTSLE